MTDATDPSRPFVDSASIVADRQALTPETRRALYRRVFGGADGQTVLLDLLVQAAVSAPRPSSLTHDERTHLDGQQWVVLSAMNHAGYGAADIAGVLISNSMRGLDSHDRHTRSQSRERPDPILPGDPEESF